MNTTPPTPDAAAIVQSIYGAMLEPDSDTKVHAIVSQALAHARSEGRDEAARVGGGIACAIAASEIDDSVKRALQPFITAGLADAEGRPRKVLGALPVTADGCIIGDGPITTYDRDGSACSANLNARTIMGEHSYSTQAAAEAARGQT